MSLILFLKRGYNADGGVMFKTFQKGTIKPSWMPEFLLSLMGIDGWCVMRTLNGFRRSFCEWNRRTVGGTGVAGIGLWVRLMGCALPKKSLNVWVFPNDIFPKSKHKRPEEVHELSSSIKSCSSRHGFQFEPKLRGGKWCFCLNMIKPPAP